FRVIEVQRNAVFATVKIVKKATAVEVRRVITKVTAAQEAQQVRTRHGLDANNFSAMVSEDFCTDGCGPEPGEIEHTYALQGRLWRCGFAFPFPLGEGVLCPEKKPLTPALSRRKRGQRSDNLGIVLTQTWGAASELPGGGREHIGRTWVAQGHTEVWMLDVNKKLPCLQLRTFYQVTRCLHWRQRHTIVLRLGVGLLLGLGGEKRLQGRVHLRVMLKAIHIVNQALVGQRSYRPFCAEPGNQALPAELASTAERDIAILTWQDIGGSLPSMPTTRAYLAVEIV